MPKGLISRLVALFKNHLTGTSGLIVMASLVVAFSLVRGLLTFGRINIASIATERSIKTLRNRLYNHIQLLPYSYHSKAETGNLIQRCTSDVETIRLALYSQIMDTIAPCF